jgi:GH15 family glucan-1,4-alpha-glucosidase
MQHTDPYQPIENYGIIGNMRTIALVGKNGSIDWFCYPHFDSPSIFGRILDHKKGGHFSVESLNEGVTNKQIYWPDTNVLITRYLSPTGVGEVTDYMPVRRSDMQQGARMLIRRLYVVHGSMKFRVECKPAFDYARKPHRVEIIEKGAKFITDELTMCVATDVTLTEGDNGMVYAEFELKEEESAYFIFHELKDNASEPVELSKEDLSQLFRKTVNYWHKWLSKSTYTGRWREMVNRSALVLKLLTFEPTGAIVAAPTTSLPETMGGSRNWDYRYTWVRDAAFTLYGLLRIGFTDEAAKFMEWIAARCREEEHENGPLQIMYCINGDHELPEEELSHLEGYRKSAPVRVGNGASNQLQLDIYGELLDSVYIYNKYGAPISHDLWVRLRRMLNWLCDNWNKKDEGVWEVRGGRQNFTYSRLMCWVALDRGLRIAEKRSFPAEREKWTSIRDQIYEDVMKNGWSNEIQAFRQHYDTNTLDASVLLMPLVFFIAPNDPRWLSTLKAIYRSPQHGGLVSNSLVYRYLAHETDDGLEGQEEGTFNMCTFWLVECLTRAGDIETAQLVFEQMLGYANHLGLYAEQTGNSGEALGNFPQAFTHLGLISAAYNLDKALNNKKSVKP